jgi:hypothetical protein
MRKLLLATVALVALGGVYAKGNYDATQGTGTTFASAVISAVHYTLFLVCDATIGTTCAAVKAASTAPQATDPALVVSLSPNSAGIVAPGQAAMAASAPVAIASNQTGYPVFPSPTTSGGLSNYFVQPAASDNHVVIKAGAGQVYKIMVTNNSATVNYLRLYDATTGFNGCNSATNLIYQVAIPASTSVGGISDSWPNGMTFATGISICVTSGYATTDTTNATATAMSVNVGYK